MVSNSVGKGVSDNICVTATFPSACNFENGMINARGPMMEGSSTSDTASAFTT